MKNFILIISILFTIAASAQTKEYFEDGVTVKKITDNEGNSKEFYRSGKLAATGKKESWKRIGEWKEYYEGGALKSIGNYNDNEETGNWKFYHDNGQLSGMGEMSTIGRVGNWELYHNNGKLSGAGKYDEDGYPIPDTWTTYNDLGETHGCDCPEPTAQMYSNMCHSIYERQNSQNPGPGISYKYQELLWKISCAKIGIDKLPEARIKIQCMWSNYREKIRCYNYPTLISSEKNVMKFSLDTGFTALISEAVKRYKLDMNFIDPSDKKTILDFIEETEKEIRNSPPIDTSRADEYQSMYQLLRTNGAKHSRELKQ